MRSEVRTQLALRGYYLGFVGVLIGTFLPSKALGYMLPLLFTAWAAAYGALSRNRMFAVIAGATLLGAFYVAVLDEFIVSNYVVALITFSSFLPILVIPTALVASEALLLDMLAAALPVMLVEGAIGIVQAFAGALHNGTFGGNNGDVVAGTIYPHLTPEKAFSNPMFAVNIVYLLLACLSRPETSRGRARMPLVISAIALVLASVVHVLVFVVVAIVVAFVFTRSRRAGGSRVGRRVFAVVLGISALSALALSDNLALTTKVAEHAFDLEAEDIPRAYLMARVAFELPEEQPQQPYIGVGLGQFSSRAALIMSGLYLGGVDHPKPLPLLSPRMTRLADDYTISLLVAMNEGDRDIGSSQQPFFSYMTVYSECGIVGCIAVLFAFGWVLLRAGKLARRSSEARMPGLLVCAGILLLLFLGWQAAYWETPQAIFVGMLLLKVMYATLTRGASEQTRSAA